MTTGEMIRKLRQEIGLTQKQFGQLCNINESQIRRYELGLDNSNPKIETLRKIAEAFVESCDDIDYELFESMSKYAGENESINVMLQFMWKKFLEKNPEFSDSLKDAKSNIGNKILEKHKELLQKYESLNSLGQQKAIEHIDMLAKIPEYKKEN